MEPDTAFLPHTELHSLFTVLRKQGYRCVGPVQKDGAIVFTDIHSVEQLPKGVHDEQAPGRYRISGSDSNRYFAWASGPQALKPLLFVSHEPLWKCQRDDNGRLTFEPVLSEVEPVAVIGVRPCDLAALHLQDKHFLQSGYQDPYYLARRKNLFLVAVNCTHPADTCFCASTGDGPQARSGFDIALTELDDGFIVQPHSENGGAMVGELGLQPAGAEQKEAADQALRMAGQSQTRRLPGRNLYQALFDHLDHPRWDDIAKRCLACGNCTSVCPTCFCHSQYEEAALDGQSSQHYRQWDSCFSAGHSYIHGLTVRNDIRTRYRQWLTHKLGSWHRQYGRSGCTGCGRCITWCPVGIDITEEAAAICEGEIV